MKRNGGDDDMPSSAKRLELSFTVQTIDCIACTPVFRRHLGKIGGVLEVKELPMTNKIIVVFDGTLLDRSSLERQISKISEKAGFGDKIIFRL